MDYKLGKRDEINARHKASFSKTRLKRILLFSPRYR